MSGYTKLFGEIVNSTIWREPHTIRLVWITMLAICDRHGHVNASIPGLADAARVTIPEVETALKALASPDQYSRTKDNAGRRIAEIDGGWVLLNHSRYRKKLSQDERREYFRNWRKRRKEAGEDATRTQQNATLATAEQQFEHIADADADTKADTDTEALTGIEQLPLIKPTTTQGTATTPERKKIALGVDGKWLGVAPEMVALWQEAYPAVDVQLELGRSAAWAMANPKFRKSNWQRFLVGWFSRTQDRARPGTPNAGNGKHATEFDKAQREYRAQQERESLVNQMIDQKYGGKNATAKDQ